MALPAGTDPLRGFSVFSGASSTGPVEKLFNPATHGDWIDRYSWLLDILGNATYSPAEAKHSHMWRAEREALSQGTARIDIPRRMVGLAGYVARRGQVACTGGTQTLDVLPRIRGKGKRQRFADQGAAIWARSDWQRQKVRAAHYFAGVGSVFLESVRETAQPPHKARIVLRDPRNVAVTYDDWGTEIVSASISIHTLDTPVPRSTGTPTEFPTLNEHRRHLTQTRVDVFVNGAHVPEESGEHGLGRVPLVQACFEILGGDIEHGRPCYEGMLSAIPEVDSVWTEIKAIANRYAHPHLAFIGTQIAGQSKLANFGRIWELPEGADVKVIESALSQIVPLANHALTIIAQIKAQFPEFLFTEAGAGSSGTALSLRATDYEQKYTAARGVLFPAIARVTQMAAAMEADAPVEDLALYSVSAGPLLPVNRKGELEMVTAARTLGILREVDLIRHLQQLEIIPSDIEPEAYQALKEEDDLAALAPSPAAPAPPALD